MDCTAQSKKKIAIFPRLSTRSFPALYYATCHEYVWRNENIASGNLYVGTRRKLNSQFHASAALSPEEQPLLRLRQLYGKTAEIACTRWKREISFASNNNLPTNTRPFSPQPTAVTQQSKEGRRTCIFGTLQTGFFRII